MMEEDRFNIRRFLDAQEGVYAIALQELRDGRKRSHWMWYIFPQLKHLGHSSNSKYYGLSGIEEARAYLGDPVLAYRLREVCGAILSLPIDDAKEVLGGIDSRKLRSSMTLFDMVSPNDVFADVLNKFFDGRKDRRTSWILAS